MMSVSLMQRIARSAELMFCFAAFSTYSGAYIGMTQPADYKMGNSNPVNAAAQAVILWGLVTLITVRWRKVLFVAVHGGAVNLFVMLALASTLWSNYPAITFKRAVLLLETVCFAYYLLATFSIDRVIRLCAFVLTISTVASLVVALAFPSLGVMSGGSLDGAWRGVFIHKNQLGASTLLGTLCVGWLWWHEPNRRLHYGLCLLLCLGLAVMSRSKTAQVIIVLTFIWAAYSPLLRLPGLSRIWASYFMIAASLTIGGLLIAFFGPIMTALGKDASFTGRVPAWAVLLEIASNHLGLGSGYGAFFIDGNLDSDYVSGRAGWLVVEAHDGYIQVLLELGIPGLLLAIWTLARSFYGSVRLWLEGIQPWASFAVVYLISFSVTNLVESDMFPGGDLNCAIFPMIYVAPRMRGIARLDVTSSGVRPWADGQWRGIGGPAMRQREL
jgi:exopolysaccharide production protein ExoQ